MSEKPIREYDRFIVRLPDGMREKLQARAAANARSMNAEVVAMLEEALSSNSETDLHAMAHEALKLERQVEAARWEMESKLRVLGALQNELYRLVGDPGEEPISRYALRVALDREADAQEAKEAEATRVRKRVFDAVGKAVQDVPSRVASVAKALRREAPELSLEDAEHLAGEMIDEMQRKSAPSRGKAVSSASSIHSSVGKTDFRED